jgi:glycosyltransferase involved in cell wall biosynthesis
LSTCRHCKSSILSTRDFIDPIAHWRAYNGSSISSAAELIPTQFMTIDVLIPAYNEEASIGKVIAAVPRDRVRQIVVGNNGSTDRTAEIASSLGAVVVPAPQRGYGSACLAMMQHIRSTPPDVVVFLDGDFSDFPEQLVDLVAPIVAGSADFVLGSRTLKPEARRHLTPQQRFGNWLACFLMRLIWRHRYSDLGPFRAIRRTSLESLGMVDTNFGWTVEMQIKAVRKKLRTIEVPVDYRLRAGGESKVSGTISGVFRAGYKILFVIFKYAVQRA